MRWKLPENGVDALLAALREHRCESFVRPERHLANPTREVLLCQVIPPPACIRSHNEDRDVLTVEESGFNSPGRQNMRTTGATFSGDVPDTRP